MATLKNIFFFILLLSSLQGFANADTTLRLHQTKIIQGNFSDFYVDNLGNVYLITSTNQIKKINSNGDSLAVFNDVKRYGNIFLMDVTNPLKILVYYKDFSTVIILDRFLNAVNTIDLRQSGILQAKAIALSYDGNIWVFDELNGKLKKVDENGNILLESSDFRLLFSDPFNPTKIIDNSGQLYLYDEKKGWLLFDYYGAFKKQFPFTNWKDVQVKDNRLQGRDSINLYYFTPVLLELTKAALNKSLSTVIKLQQQMNNLYALTSEGVYIYSIQQ
ncbi:MAG: hypothetical protein ACR2FN_10180 [Chitinophagaceae bacterium]